MNWGMFTLSSSEHHGMGSRGVVSPGVSLLGLPAGLDVWPKLLAWFSDLLQL